MKQVVGNELFVVSVVAVAVLELGSAEGSAAGVPAFCVEGGGTVGWEEFEFSRAVAPGWA